MIMITWQRREKREKDLNRGKTMENRNEGKAEIPITDNLRLKEREINSLPPLHDSLKTKESYVP